MNIKNLITKGLLALAALLSAENAAAQQDDYTPLPAPYEFLGVKDFSFSTQMVLGDEGYEYWNGGLHTGLQLVQLTVFNHSEINKNAPQLENPRLICDFFDANGRLTNHVTTSMVSSFNKFKFSKRISTMTTSNFTMLRGGEYDMKVEIAPGLYARQEKIVLADEPCMHQLTPDCVVDSIVSPKLYISSGYPYNYADFAGQKNLHWTVALDNAPENVLMEGDATFELKSDLPTLAAVDSVVLNSTIADPGKYRYTVTSGFAPANAVYTFKILDVLHPEVTLDKTVYTAGESKEAIVTVNMSYGYPYVGKVEPPAKPTVQVCAEFMGQETSVEYSDEAWADSDMHCTAQLKIALDKVTDAVVKEYEGKVPLNLTIRFNGSDRMESSEIIPFGAPASVETIIGDADGDKRPAKYFNALGVEVDDSYRGFIITSDGRKILR